MARSCTDAPIEPTDLADMRENGMRSLAVSCWNCHHEAVLSAERWPDDVPVPSFGPRVPPAAELSAADARPNWKERPERQSMTGVQWAVNTAGS
jgi:hypothetical protein